MHIPIDRRAWPIASILFSLALIFWFFYKPICIAIDFVMILHLAFFRDPERSIPAGDALLSPADGQVVEVSNVFEDRYLKEEAVRIRLFLSIFVPHISRIPMTGKVQYLKYEPGEFVNALKPESFTRNESNWIGIQGSRGCILVRRIAGMIAKRIYCDIDEGSEVKRGERYGIICYSSGAECYIPTRLFKPTTQVGEHLQAGKSILGEWI